MGFFSGRNTSGSNENGDSQDQFYAEAKRNRNNTLFIFIAIIVVYLGYTMFSQSSYCAGQPTTTGRIKMADGLCQLTEFVFPKGGASDYTNNTDFLESMVDFYGNSGVQPVLYDLTGEEAMTADELQAFADDFYDNESTGLFSDPQVNDHHDEGHFLVVFQANGDSYNVAYHVGKNAATVIDEDAVGIFSSVLDNAFANKKAKDVFKVTFKDANSKIMGRAQGTTYIIVILAVLLVAYMGFSYYRNRDKFKKGDQQS